MRTEQKFGTSIKAIVAGVALVSGLIASAVPAGAVTTAPALSTMDRTIVGSGSDTTYDLMMTLDKVYNAANGCATIWASSASQPFSGECDTADTAAGNGPDKSSFPWVNDSHAVIKQLYPVGSGVGQNELCKQNLVNVRGVDFARSSSGPTSGSTNEKCSDLKYIAYAEDAVTWYHFTKNPDGTDTASARIVSIDQATLKTIFRGEVTLWSQLNGNSGVLDVNGNPFAAVESSATPTPAVSTSASPLASPLPSTGIVLYSTQTASGTYSYFTNSARTNSSTKMGAPAASPVPSQTAHAVYTTNQENYPAAIAQDKNTNNAIYFMSVGRYKQIAKITDQVDAYSSATATGTKNAGGYADALGQIDGKAPTIANIAKGADKTTGYFPYSRDVFNVTRYASAATNAYVGPNGFLCTITDSTKDRIKMDGYRTILEAAIKAEGFAPLTLSSGSYCRVRAANTAQTADDATAPSITLAAPAPSANASGAATFTINFNEPVRATDASKLTVTQTGNSSIAFTTTATNSKGVTVNAFDSENTNDLDPYANKVVSNLVVNVTGIAYDADGSKPVTVSLAAAAVKDRAGNSSALATFTTASNTTAPVVVVPDTEAPTVADNGSTYKTATTSLPGSFKLTFSEPVRNIDLTKFSYVDNTATGPRAIATPAAVYTCKTATGRTVVCNSDANNNDDNPSASLAVKTMDIKLGKTAVLNGSLFIAAGAFNDKAGNNNDAAVLKKSLYTNNLVVAGTWTSTANGLVSSVANGTRTYGIWGTSATVVLGRDVKGGKVSVKIDGVEYAKETPADGQISWDLNGSGTATVTKTGLALGWHTVIIKNLGQSPTAAGTTAVKATFVKVTVKSVS